MAIATSERIRLTRSALVFYNRDLTGGVAERLKALVLKTSLGRPSASSNLAPSATSTNEFTEFLKLPT